MKLVTAWQDGRTFVGVVVDGEVVDVSAVVPDMLAVVRGGTPMSERIEAALAFAPRQPLDQVRLRAPIPEPVRNVFCVGLNYLEHALEGEARRRPEDVPELPVWFTKATTSICGPFDDIELDPDFSAMYDWEVELAVVIGRAGRRISTEQALDHIHSYTIINDVTARDVQRRPGRQWFKGRSVDRSSPLGPCLITPDEIADLAALRLTCEVNGVTMQSASTEDLLTAIPALIADISEGITLLPGDIIATGTPAGTGAGQSPPRFLVAGDELVTEIAGIGRMRNRMISPAAASAPL